jgi:hypothetical protein
VARVLDRTSSVLSRNFLAFFIVTTIAQLPAQVLSHAFAPAAADAGPNLGLGMILIAIGLWLLTFALGMFCQAIVLYGAFQQMRGQPVSLTDSLQVGLRRFFPILGLTILSMLGVLGAAILLFFPALIPLTMWFVATPACVVERLGPVRSLGRSRWLTKGHRWKILGLILSQFIVLGIVSGALAPILGSAGGTTLALLGAVLWSGLWGAFYAISVVVTYHDLRVAKEGIDIEQIAAVFD